MSQVGLGDMMLPCRWKRDATALACMVRAGCGWGLGGTATLCEKMPQSEELGVEVLVKPRVGCGRHEARAG